MIQYGPQADDGTPWRFCTDHKFGSYRDCPYCKDAQAAELSREEGSLSARLTAERALAETRSAAVKMPERVFKITV